MLHAKHEAQENPSINVQIARAYLHVADAGYTTRKWSDDYIRNEALKGPWITLLQLESHTDGLTLFCALTAKDRRAALLKDEGWDWLAR